MELPNAQAEDRTIPANYRKVTIDYAKVDFGATLIVGNLAYYRYKPDIERKIEAKAGKGALPEIYRSDKTAKRIRIGGREWFRSTRTLRKGGTDFVTEAYFTRSGKYSVLLTFTTPKSRLRHLGPIVDRVLLSARSLKD
ncbi:MAG: hypothetical protein ACO1SV_25435 [Fimbriimonas sp.]